MNSVLYDAPGPRTRRRTILASIIAVPVIVALAYMFIYRPLDTHGQFEWKLWAPMLDPSSEYFPLVWARWRDGWINTLKAAVLSIIASLVVGTFLALLRRELRERRQGFKLVAASILRAPTRIWVEIARGTPVVVTIFFVFRVLPDYGIDFDDRLWFLVIGLTIYNSVVIGEILRSGMEGLHFGQREAALAVGLNSLQTSWLVLLPQAFRVMLPALISQLVVVVKDTSLGGVMLSYEEALGVTKNMKEAFQSNENLAIGIPMYFAIGLMYIAVNYGLSKFAQFMQKRVGSRQRKVQTTTTMVVVESGRAV
jgi:glutamate transport system permease protein